MQIVVQKYGGSSVADIERIRRVARRVADTRAAGAAVVVVVSAMGSTTNDLVALARQMSTSPDPRELDMLISVGERISMALLAMALRDLGVPATSLTGSQAGIITDESHADARVVEVRPLRVREGLEAGKVVIVAGFQGVSRAKEVTTLGRGGSDQTAVVLAAALGADHCEICSDVDGVWSADPRVVPEAVRLDRISLEETLALARGGAKVLYEEAVRYARDHGVEIQASHTFEPGIGTRIVAGGVAPIVAVAGDRQLGAIRVIGEPEAAARALRAAGVKVRRVLGDRLHVDLRNAHGGVPENAAWVNEGAIAVVSAVSSGLAERWEDVARASVALSALGVLEHGAAGDTAFWRVAPDALDEAVRRVHHALRHG